jgi:hypothetical protein
MDSSHSSAWKTTAIVLGTAGFAAAGPNAVIRNQALWEEMRAGKHLTTPPSHEIHAAETLPVTFSWGNVNGTSFLTTIRNQHIPVYCGSCWAMGSSSALADRHNIAESRAGNVLPQRMLAVQNIISCGNAVTQCGTCNGGDDGPVYQYAKKDGIPTESCSNYMASDTTCSATKPISAQNKPGCYTCSPSGNPACKPIARGSFGKLWVAEYGDCSGYAKMKVGAAGLLHSPPPATSDAPSPSPPPPARSLLWRTTPTGRDLRTRPHLLRH